VQARLADSHTTTGITNSMQEEKAAKLCFTSHSTTLENAPIKKWGMTRPD
jgi:hypothetical protein